MSDDQISDPGENNAVAIRSSAHDESWARLKESYDPRAFSQAWLEIQSRLIGADARCGVVVLGVPEQGPFEPIAV